MNQLRMQQLIDRFAGRRIIVLGDLMLDTFIWGEVKRISPEAPVPVVDVKRESWHLGGAGNVTSNLLGLGAHVSMIGVIGKDTVGERLCQYSAERGADISGIVIDPSRPTTLKTRLIAHGQQMIRFDREDRSPISFTLEDAILSRFNTALETAEAVVISDYEKGTLTPRLLRAAIAAARARGRTICLDPKIRNWLSYSEVDAITPNQLEAERATGIEITDETSLGDAARRIRQSLGCRSVLITRGEHGMSLLESDESVTHIPTVAREVYDVTGAGDTVIATLALTLAAGGKMHEAAIIANHAAGIVVGKIGTATVSRAELINAFYDDEGKIAE